MTAVTSPDREPDKDAIVAAAQKQEVESVLVVHLIGISEESKYTPGPTASEPFEPQYDDLTQFYGSMDATAGGPGYYRTEEVVELQSRLFETKTEKMIWQLITRSANPGSVEDLVESFGDLIMKNLKKDNLLLN